MGINGIEKIATQTLRQWIEREGTEGRRRLYKAIKERYPRFTQVSLTNYIQGQRLPDFEVAQIISQVTQIPIFLLAFRFVHKPGSQGTD